MNQGSGWDVTTGLLPGSSLPAGGLASAVSGSGVRQGAAGALGWLSWGCQAGACWEQVLLAALGQYLPALPSVLWL